MSTLVWKHRPHYSKDLVLQRIEAESCVLENHGYLLAAAAVERWGKDLEPLDAELSVPHPDWMEENPVWAALAGSPHP